MVAARVLGVLAKVAEVHLGVVTRDEPLQLRRGEELEPVGGHDRMHAREQRLALGRDLLVEAVVSWMHMCTYTHGAHARACHTHARTCLLRR